MPRHQEVMAMGIFAATLEYKEKHGEQEAVSPLPGILPEIQAILGEQHEIKNVWLHMKTNNGEKCYVFFIYSHENKARYTVASPIKDELITNSDMAAKVIAGIIQTSFENLPPLKK